MLDFLILSAGRPWNTTTSAIVPCLWSTGLYSLDDFSQDDPSQMLTEQVHSNNGLAGNVYVTCRSV